MIKIEDIPSLNYFIRISKLANNGKLVHLDILCDDEKPGLWQSFNNTDELRKYINNNIDCVYIKVVQKVDATHFVINCATRESAALYICAENWYKWVGKSILIFMPIIQKFMVDALTDNLYIVENGELVKQ